MHSKPLGESQEKRLAIKSAPVYPNHPLESSS